VFINRSTLTASVLIIPALFLAALWLAVGCAPSGKALPTTLPPPPTLRQQVSEGGLWVEARAWPEAEHLVERQLAREGNDLWRFFGTNDVYFVRDQVMQFHQRLFALVLGRLRASSLRQVPWNGDQVIFEVMNLSFYDSFNKDSRENEIQCVAQVRVVLLDRAGAPVGQDDLIVMRFRQRPGGRQDLLEIERAVANGIESLLRTFAGATVR
jgi:hypothetical protein